METNFEFALISFDGENEVLDTILDVFADKHLPRTIASYKKTKNQKMLEINSSAIVALESIESIKTFNSRAVLTSDFYKPFQFIMYCPSVTVDEISKLDDNKITIDKLQFEFFVIQEGTRFSLMTFVWYTAEKCGEPQLIKVNSFSKKTNLWAHNRFKIDKFATFHGCWLRFMFLESIFDYLPLIRTANRADETIDCTGYICEMVKAISSNLNFKYHSNFYDKLEGRYFFRNNKYDFDWETVSQIVVHRLQKKVFGKHKKFAAHFYSPIIRSENNYMAISSPQSYDADLVLDCSDIFYGLWNDFCHFFMLAKSKSSREWCGRND